MNRTKKLAFLSLCVTVSLMLSFVESLLPPFIPAVPGIKAGLANIMIIFLLMTFGVRDAALVSFVRLVLSCTLFGTLTIFIYSFIGAFFSLGIMWILKKTKAFSTVAVSIAGGVFHNIGQIAVAVLLLQTKEISYFTAPLIISGIVAGAFVGIAAVFLIHCLKRVKP